MKGNIITGIAGILVSVILIGSILVPIINEASGSPAWDETITTVYNTDPETPMIKYDGSDIDLELWIDSGYYKIWSVSSGIDVVEMSVEQSFIIIATDTFVLFNDADDGLCLCCLEYLGGDDPERHEYSLYVGDETDKITIDNGAGFVSLTGPEDNLVIENPSTYIYFVSINGEYGSFSNDVHLKMMADDPIIACGTAIGEVAVSNLLGEDQEFTYDTDQDGKLYDFQFTGSEGDPITASCILAPTTITEVIHHEGSVSPYSTLYGTIVLMVIIAILLAAVGFFIAKKDY